MNYLDEPREIPGILKDGRGRQTKTVKGRGNWGRMGRDEILLTLKRMEGSTNQGMWATSGRWKKQRNTLYPRISRSDHTLANTLILAQWDTH